MQNDKVGEGDVFFKRKRHHCLICIKISKQSNTNYIDKYKNLEQKFDNISGFATAIFRNIASVSKIELTGSWAKGLRLRNLRGTRVRRCRTFPLTKQETGSKIEESHRKLKRTFEPKVGKILFGVSSFEQTPRFATNKHFVTMNP
jgi:hypothetical protein